MAFCSSCGTNLSPSAAFCAKCGAPVENTDEVATIDYATTSASKTSSGSPSSRGSSPSHTSHHSEYLLSEGRFLPGRLIFGRYRIVALLGKGGMGEVYRADDLTLGQAVAMKFLPEEATHDEAMLERFHSEVRIARRVSHPNVCRVYDVGEVDGHTFLTMSTLMAKISRLSYAASDDSHKTRLPKLLASFARASQPLTRRAFFIATSSPPTSC